jgi:hypothetical protein
MNSRHLAIGVGVLLLVTVVAAGQEAPALQLGAAARSADLPSLLRGPGRFENGFEVDLVFRENRVQLYDSAGRLVRTNDVVVPGAETTSVLDASVSKEGLVAVVAYSADSQGARVGTISLFDQSGPAKLVIRTNPFVPTMVDFAPDGFIWVVGWIPEIENGVRIPSAGIRPANPEDKERQCVLERYSPEGVLAGSFLKRSNFDRQVYPWRNGPGGTTALRFSASGIGLYVAHDDGSGEWVELSLAGDFKGRWTIPPPAEGLSANSITFTDSGSAYARWSLVGRANAGRVPGEGTYRLNKTTSRWERLSDIPAPRTSSSAGSFDNFFTYLLGADGDSLVFASRRGQTAGMLWFKEPAR